ncbi:transposase [Streptomyces sp. NPDC007206]|uniref:transposase n=1 Tax=Streptomyces sp. NPDC007206 TaxID=3154317 RepID=UPI0033FF3D0B
MSRGAGFTKRPTSSTPCRRSAQPGAKKALQDVHNAEDRDQAEATIKTFVQLYGAKLSKAVKKITTDRDQLLAFYGFPAEHWIHLRVPRTPLSRPSPPSGCGPRSPAAPAPAPPPWPCSSNSSSPPSSGGGP